MFGRVVGGRVVTFAASNGAARQKATEIQLRTVYTMVEANMTTTCASSRNKNVEKLKGQIIRIFMC